MDNNVKLLGCSVVAIIFIAVILALMANTNENLPQIDKTGSGIVIGGNYGININKSDVIDISLTDKFPANYTKKMGGGIGKKLEGVFEDTNENKFRLYVVDKDNAPYILIRTKEVDIYINDHTKEKTEILYEKLK